MRVVTRVRQVRFVKKYKNAANLFIFFRLYVAFIVRSRAVSAGSGYLERLYRTLGQLEAHDTRMSGHFLTIRPTFFLPRVKR